MNLSAHAHVFYVTSKFVKSPEKRQFLVFIAMNDVHMSMDPLFEGIISIEENGKPKSGRS